MCKSRKKRLKKKKKWYSHFLLDLLNNPANFQLDWIRNDQLKQFDIAVTSRSQLVSWHFEPSQSQTITSGLKTNFTLSPSYSFQKSSYHKSCFLSLFIFHGHSIQEPASSSVTCFILQAYTGTSVSHSQRRKKSGEVLEKCR